jgi:hypothetical protein
MNYSSFAPTGTVYAVQSQANPFRERSGNVLNMFNPEFSQIHQTGQDFKITFISEEIQPVFAEFLPMKALLTNITGYELFVDDTIRTFLSSVSTRYVTGYRVSLASESPFPEKSRDTFTSNAAVQLREISGLDIKDLARIFCVSRSTYHKWMKISNPHFNHRKHLLEVLSLVKAVMEKVGRPVDVANWLLTPVTDNGIRPIDYLATQEFGTFRGFLLSIRTGSEVIRLLNSPALVRKNLPREEVEREIENLSLRSYLEDEINLGDPEL